MVEEVHDLVQLLDEMSRMLQKMQYKACSQEVSVLFRIPFSKHFSSERQRRKYPTAKQGARVGKDARYDGLAHAKEFFAETRN